MVSVKRIKKGEEVFNTYGELANWQLLHMYGFVESYPSNTNDSADIQMATVYKAALQAARTESERSLVVEKWDLLCQLDIVGEEGAFVFGQSGSLTDEELYTSLKVLCMPVEQFKEFKENEGWEEAEEDDEDEMAAALSNDGIPKLSLPWRRLLGDSVALTLQDYADELQPDKELLGDRQAYGRLSSRERLALQLRYGQKVLCMPVEQFKEFKENEGWEEAEEDDEDEMAAALSNDGIPKLSLPWRRLLGDSVALTLQDYADELQPDKELLGDRQAYGRLSSRERLALQLRYGQKVTLHQLLELTRCHSV
ncbi:N-lysine methyltransferase setd6 [Acipenser ruthenus]|uniref:N-lysine methyltransferase SETD6 n=1 Tax=Acipenser ruthenus TaxID=7906 RepID=A0A444UD19_ACIRT|nr:N-lysine methyltransferase setd6 [Acipenser ruthenus]